MNFLTALVRNPRPLSTRIIKVPGAVTLLLAATSAAADTTRALADMSLEELAGLRVFSASRQLEPTSGVPSAIYVLTNEDLLRSGVTSVPDALRLVPGVQVGRVDANKWAVSMRGFNSREANKLLVLVDGRSIYDPLFSGMLWESQDFLLEDIDRIEVIRGPGGTLWGANAFNGVINIITKHSSDTTGTFAMLTTGSEDDYIAGLRHGWQWNERQHARVYLKGRERDTGFSALLEPFDDLRDLRGGFRWDWSNESGDAVRVSGDVFDAVAGVRETPVQVHRVDHDGHNLLAQWTRRHSPGNGWRLQFYYDDVGYESIGYVQQRDTYDIEFQHNLQAGARHAIVWGAGYRRMRDHTATTVPGIIDVLPARRHDAIETIFVQDTISLLPEALQLVLGIKYEDTDYADARWLPSARLAFMPSQDQTWWAAVSEATRVPSRLEADLTFFGTIRIGDGFEAEEVRAYEAGYRRLLSPALWFDAAVFHNDYRKLVTREAGGPLANFMEGYTRGAEVAVRWDPLDRVRLHGSYTWLDMDLSLDPQSSSDSGMLALLEGLVSRHQLAVRAAVDLGDDLDLDATVRYVDELRAIAVPAYTQLDLVLRWAQAAQWELSLAGANLLDSHQPEQVFALSATGMPTEVQRSFYVRATWRR